MKSTTVKVPADLREQYLAEAERTYGKLGKSRWICAALEDLEEGDPALQTVGLGEAELTGESRIQLQLREDDQERLDRLVVKVRRQDPRAEGVQSQILRAAIRWKLARSRGPRSVKCA